MAFLGHCPTTTTLLSLAAHPRMDTTPTGPVVVTDLSGYHALQRAFDPDDPVLQRKPIRDICPWASGDVAQFTLAYLKKRVQAKLNEVSRTNPVSRQKSPWGCYFGTWARKTTGYAGTIKLRQCGREGQVRMHILLLLVRGYVAAKGFEHHHICNLGHEGCIGDPYETGTPQHVIPVPKEVNGQAKSKKCWGMLCHTRCDGHTDNQGRRWPPCPPPPETAAIVTPPAPATAPKKRLREIQDEVEALKKRIAALEGEATEVMIQLLSKSKDTAHARK